MNEDFDSLEAELSGLRPRNLTSDLTYRIAAPLSLPQGRSWSDRLLVCAIGSGAIAACIIVLLLLGEPALRDRPQSVIASTPAPRAGDLSVFAERQEGQLASAWK
jgi:hypothetical protein